MTFMENMFFLVPVGGSRKKGGVNTKWREGRPGPQRKRTFFQSSKKESDKKHDHEACKSRSLVVGPL